MKALHLVSERANGSVVVTVTGELDLATRPELVAYVRHAVDVDTGTIIIDLSGVTFIDACGLSALIALKRYAREQGRPLLLAGATPPVLRLLKLTNLDGTFTMISRPGAAGAPPVGRANTGPAVQTG
ncbi:anti-sigma B factor antagonist [Streptosporangium becharense]|uniref:Anti-sigma factor antagonist n=1 Tax=Streptosporangium becharense TaxID=1816182 RepID=A0A7W9IEW7_9ACTN|nr:STAS domain-containing protein [Streptosporangium becharense]MBB2909666.1 anti-sigma B factor antagonist [Streptosporangium becharense]MBB5819378.1 anti-sigma B factor antagonist [Streptosporangium becharense]